jgi:Spy/CpxP family protein refolding chaperone
MKLKRILTLCAVTAALTFNVSTLLAQDANNNNNGNNNNGGQNGNGGGGGRRGGGGNFDPAQFQQRMMDGVRDRLGFTNDTDWSAVQPLVQKVMDAQRDARGAQMRGMFGGRNRGGNNGGGGGGGGGGRGGFGGQPTPEADALQKALDDNAPAAQVKDLLTKYRASQKDKQAKLVSAQSDLKKVLTTKQEAQATLLGLVD